MAASTLWVSLRADVQTLMKDVDKGVGILGGFQKKAEAIQKILIGLFAFKGVEAGISKIEGFSKAIMELAKEGEAVQSVKNSFLSLGGEVDSIEKARESVLGVVDSFDLMAIANRGLMKGIPDFNDAFVKITELGGRLGKALKEDVKTSIDDLTIAIVKGNARALRPLGMTFTDTKNRALVTKEAIAQLDTAIARLPAMTESSSKAFISLNVTWDEFKKNVGISIDQNLDLAKGFRQLEASIKDIDFKTLGQNLAAIEGVFVNIANTVLPAAISLLNDFGRGLDDLIGKSKQAEADRAAMGLQNAKSDLAAVQGGGLEAWANKQLGFLPPNEAQAQSEVDRFTKKYQDAIAALKAADPVIKAVGVSTKGLDDANGKAADSIDKLTKKLASEQEKLLEQRADRIVTAAIDQNNPEAYKKIEEWYRVHVAQGVIDGFTDANGNIPDAIRDQVIQQARDEADLKVKTLDEKWVESSKKRADEDQKNLEQAFQNSVNFFDDIFTQIITTGTLNFSKMLQEIGIKFAAQMAASLTGGMQISSVGDIGTVLAKQLLGTQTGGGGLLSSIFGSGTSAAASGGGTSLAGLFGAGGSIADASGMLGSFGMTGSAAAAAGIEGPAMASGMFTAGSGLLGAVGAAAPYAAAGFALYEIGKGLFKHKKNPDTVARNKVFDYLKQNGINLDFGTSADFNAGHHGFDALNAFPPTTRDSFTALGDAIKNTLGITQNIGGEIGAVLARNFGDNLSKAKALFEELGLSAEDMAKAVIKSGLAAGRTWEQIEADLQKLDNLTNPGRPGVGDVAGAIGDIKKSQGKGLDEIVAFQDLVVEAEQKGITTLAGLRAEMEKTLPKDQVDIMFTAMDDAGIKTFDDLKNATERTFIKIASGLDTLKFKFDEVTQAATNMQQATSGANINTSDTNTDGVTPSDGGKGATALATGGVISRRTLALMGENGPEAVLPLSRRNGRLGVNVHGLQGFGKGGFTVNIDARGAQPGVEHLIRAAVGDMEDQIMGRTISIISDASRRGGPLGN